MSPKKSRKSLDDALAQQFIYGEKQHETPGESTPEAPPSEPSPRNRDSLSALLAAGARLRRRSKQQKKSSLVGKLQTSQKEATVRFTVDLPQSMHQKLSLLAARTGKKKAEIVRMLLDEVLEDMEA